MLLICWWIKLTSILLWPHLCFLVKFTVMHLGVLLFIFSLLRFDRALWICELMSFMTFRKSQPYSFAYHFCPAFSLFFSPHLYLQLCVSSLLSTMCLMFFTLLFLFSSFWIFSSDRSSNLLFLLFAIFSYLWNQTIAFSISGVVFFSSKISIWFFLRIFSFLSTLSILSLISWAY